MGAHSALSVISTDEAEELFPAENAFLRERTCHMGVWWEVRVIQKQGELVGERR